MNAVAVILKHLVPALERARLELELAASEEARAQPASRILNSVEAAEILHVSDRTVRGWCDAGELPHRRLGRTIVISERALVAWAENGKEVGVTLRARG